MEVLEKTHGWKEEEFDVVLQYMRTVLLRRKSFPGVPHGRTTDHLSQTAPRLYTPPPISPRNCKASSTLAWGSHRY